MLEIMEAVTGWNLAIFYQWRKLQNAKQACFRGVGTKTGLLDAPVGTSEGQGIKKGQIPLSAGQLPQGTSVRFFKKCAMVMLGISEP